LPIISCYQAYRLADLFATFLATRHDVSIDKPAFRPNIFTNYPLDPCQNNAIIEASIRMQRNFAPEPILLFPKGH